jgi:dephospho-CoA kinase
MLAVAITGGVACGKSMVSEDLAEKLSHVSRAVTFSCDQSVSRCLANPELQREIAAFAPEATDDGGSGLNRAVLRKVVFENSKIREKLEALLHPLVLVDLDRFVRDHKSRADLALLEIPLLYEVDFPVARALDVIVAASESTQMSRLRVDRGIPEDIARRMLDAQWPVLKKLDRAGVAVWNDGDLLSLRNQISQVADRIEFLLED